MARGFFDGKKANWRSEGLFRDFEFFLVRSNIREVLVVQVGDMNLAYVRELYAYNRWANGKILAAVEKLDEGQFLRRMGSSFTSVRDTLVHIVGGEWIWLERWNGRSPQGGLPTVEELPDLNAIRVRWKQVEDDLSRFLQQLGEGDLEKSISYMNMKGETWTYPLWQMMAHVANHSTYHRGQVSTLLRQLGVQPTMTDFLLYYDEQTAR